MPAKPVMQYECDRCDRMWHEEYDPKKDGSAQLEILKIITLIGGAKTISYHTLCEGCEKTVKTALDTIAKELKNKSPQRGAKKEDQHDADPPRITAPQPQTLPTGSVAGNAQARPDQQPSNAGARPNVGGAPSGRSG